MIERGRVARFKVKLFGRNLDGQNDMTVEVRETAGGEDAVVGVRPKHSRLEYTALLSDVLLIVAARHAKALAQANGTPVPKPRR